MVIGQRLIVLCILGVAVVSSARTQEAALNPHCTIRAPAETFPSIRDPDASAVGDGSSIRFTVETLATYQYTYLVNTAVQVPLERLPPATVHFTNGLIERKFLDDPCAFGDRFCDVTRDNYRDKVVFRVGFSRICGDVWQYGLSVEQAPSGKPFTIGSYLIATDGTVLLGAGGEEVASCKQDGYQTLVEITAAGRTSAFTYEPGNVELRHGEDPR